MSEKIVCEYQGQYLDWDDDEHQEEDVIKCTLFTNKGIWDEYCYCDEEEAKECKLKKFVTLIEEKNIVEKNKEIERLNNIINELKWKPIEEYDKGDYDWVLVKYFDGDYECVPCVAEKRFGKWYSIDEKEIQFDVKYFMDMQQIDKLQELKGSGKE